MENLYSKKNVATSWKPKIERNFIKEFVFRKDITFFFSFFFLEKFYWKIAMDRNSKFKK